MNPVIPMELRLVYPGLEIRYAPAKGVTQTEIPEDQEASLPAGEYSIRSAFRVAVHSKHFVLIPEEVPYRDLGAEPLIQLGMSSGCPFGVAPLKAWSATLLYSLEAFPASEPERLPPSSVWQPLLTYFSDLLIPVNGPAVLVHLTPGRCYILAGSRDKLHFFNSFAVRAPEDLLYFTLKTLQEWKKNPESTPVRVSGQFEMDAPVYTLLGQYLGDLETAAPPATLLSGLDAFPSYRYVDLSSFAACASSAAS